MLYTAALLSLIASLYLLLRRGNAFAPDIMSPARLRRWTAALFASMTLSHVAYLPGVFLTSDDDILLCNLIGALFESMTVIPLAIVVLICMLQDRRRPLWSVWVMAAPLVIGMVLCVVSRSDALLPTLLGYFLLMCIGLIIYMVREVRRYGRWLRNNYADLEHKEVWQSFLEQAVILLMLSFYAYCLEWPAYEYVVQACDIVLVCYLLWRVEMLSDLQTSPQPLSNGSGAAGEPDATYEYIAPLLQQHCIETQLYLQHDLNLAQLAKVSPTGRNRSSQT